MLGPVLYLLFTADLPTTRVTTVSTFADDTAILASHYNPQLASRNLQNHLNKVEAWLKKWKIKANELKSVHTTFIMKRDKCPTLVSTTNASGQRDEIFRHASRSTPNMEKTYNNQEKATRSQNTTIILGYRKEIAANTPKQTTSV